METKKTYKANLENKRTLLTEVGLVAAMGIVPPGIDVSL